MRLVFASAPCTKGAIGFIDKVMSAYRCHSSGLWWRLPKDRALDFWRKNGHAQIGFQVHFQKVFGQDKSPEAGNIFLLTLIAFFDAGEIEKGKQLFSDYPDVWKWLLTWKRKGRREPPAWFQKTFGGLVIWTLKRLSRVSASGKRKLQRAVFSEIKRLVQDGDFGRLEQLIHQHRENLCEFAMRQPLEAG